MPDITYATIPDLTAASDSQVTDNILFETAVPDSQADSGYSSKKVTRGQLLAEVKDDIAQLDGLSDDVKTALLQLASKVAYIDDGGQSYYDALESALYPTATLESISAVYTQTGTVYDTDSLDSLKSDLVVTAHYSDSTTATVTAYTLSGTLEGGTSTITVTYGEKTTTFTVTVTATVKLTNGTKTFSDNSTLTVNNNHVTVYLATAKANGARFLNLSDVDGNSNDIFSNTNVNNKTTTFLTLNAGDVVTLDVFNAESDNSTYLPNTQSYNVAMNLREYNSSASLLTAIELYPAVTTPEHDRKTSDTSTKTMTENAVASCVFLYIPGGYPADTTFECDVRIVKEDA